MPVRLQLHTRSLRRRLVSAPGRWTAPIWLTTLCLLPPACEQAGSPGAVRGAIGVDEVLEWRRLHASAISQTQQEVVTRYGEPDVKFPDNSWHYLASDRTLNRELVLGFNGQRVWLVKVFTRPGDVVSLTDVIAKGPLFKYESGNYRDSTRAWFKASTQDGRNEIQFTIDGSTVEFASAMFFE